MKNFLTKIWGGIKKVWRWILTLIGFGVVAIAFSGTTTAPIIENTLNLDGVSVRVLIKENTAHGNFQDAIYYTLDEWSKLTLEEVDLAKSERITNWVNFVSNPLPFVEPTKEELQVEADRLETELDIINAKIDAK